MPTADSSCAQVRNSGILLPPQLISDSWMARKLEAGLDGRYLISRVLMTSTMKSEPGTPPMRGSSFGVAVSATATRMVGGSAEGRRGGALAVPAVVAALAAGGVTALAAPATATPARNLRRLTSGRGCFRVMEFLRR